ncbi:right-handed parallel beta-helix repeat-containing protein [Streptomyces sp. NPDC127084]|uniref:right-handed parallel beta-helix repeat-containing protein n=1 Tax=Streptomyces sp. NPDC127084 TaxID=3347133 RepID=UPI00365245C0
MSESQGTGAGAGKSTAHRPKTAALSRHWKVAVLAAAGFATMAATTTIVGIQDAGAVTHATPAKARTAPAAVPADGMPNDGEHGDYWANAGNPDHSGKDDQGDDYSHSWGKDDSGDKGDKGGYDKGGHDKGDYGDKSYKDNGSKGNEGKGNEGKDDYSDKGDKGGYDKDDYGDKGDKGDKDYGSKDYGNHDKDGDWGNKSDKDDDYSGYGDKAEDRSASKGNEGKGDEGKDKGDKGGHDKGDKGGKSGKGEHDKGAKAGKGDKGDAEKKQGKKHGWHEQDVDCDPDALIAALVDLNANTGGSLRLAPNCTYTLTATSDGTGLPEIIQPISIHGNGSTIQRAANADQFRFFTVGAGGELKLSHLILTRGKAPVDEGGGAIWVQEAGLLETKMVAFVNNTVDDITEDDGGAILNEGITRVAKSTFEGNSADDGSAIFTDDGELVMDDAKVHRNIGTDGAVETEGGASTITKSDIRYNIGGGVESDGGVTEIEKSEIAFNTESEGNGAGIDHEDGGLHVRGTTIHDNTATGEGGGAQLSDEAVFEDSKIVDNVTTVVDEVNTVGGGGLAIEGDETTVALRRVKVDGNQAPGNSSHGGGILVHEGSTLDLTDVKVTRNISDEPAGGIHNDGEVTTQGKIRIIDNVPTNCEGSTNPVPNCFG